MFQFLNINPTRTWFTLLWYQTWISAEGFNWVMFWKSSTVLSRMANISTTWVPLNHHWVAICLIIFNQCSVLGDYFIKLNCSRLYFNKGIQKPALNKSIDLWFKIPFDFFFFGWLWRQQLKWMCQKYLNHFSIVEIYPHWISKLSFNLGGCDNKISNSNQEQSWVRLERGHSFVIYSNTNVKWFNLSG